ncbi:MAG: YceD family protein [Candidatus Polarisedimenticolia bacterium]
MIIRLADLQPEGARIDRKLHIGPLSFEKGLEIEVLEAALEGKVMLHETGMQCQGHLTARAMVPCARCLEPFPLDMDRLFEVSYLPGPPTGASEAEIQIFRDDLDVSYLGPEGGLDVDAMAAEQIYLEIPMKPLCRSDCKGLCSRCGANLNVEPCACRTT